MLVPADCEQRRPFWQKVVLTLITIGLPPTIEHGAKLVRDVLKHRHDRAPRKDPPHEPR